MQLRIINQSTKAWHAACAVPVHICAAPARACNTTQALTYSQAGCQAKPAAGGMARSSRALKALLLICTPEKSTQPTGDMQRNPNVQIQATRPQLQC
jgi:hypothetical protein